MNQFTVKFQNPPLDVRSNHRVVEVDAMGNTVDAQAEMERERQAIFDLLSVLDSKVASLQAVVDQRTKLLKSTAFEYAIEILQNVLQNDNELATARLQAYLSAAFEDEGIVGEGAEPPRLVVHDSMVECVQQWVAEQGDSDIEIDSASDLLPGDCRIELNDNGFLASLDSQLQLLRTRVAQTDGSINNGGAR